MKFLKKGRKSYTSNVHSPPKKEKSGQQKRVIPA